MILGQVSHELDAIIPVTILDSGSHPLNLNVIIDTGFSGYLALPKVIIEELSLQFSGEQLFTLGDGQEVELNMYKAAMMWDGQECKILVVASEAQALVGMSALKGNLIFIDAIDGGDVRVEPRLTSA